VRFAYSQVLSNFVAQKFSPLSPLKLKVLYETLKYLYSVHTYIARTGRLCVATSFVIVIVI